MLAKIALALSLAMLLGATWNTALALSEDAIVVTDTRDEYTSRLFLDYLHSVMRL